MRSAWYALTMYDLYIKYVQSCIYRDKTSAEFNRRACFNSLTIYTIKTVSVERALYSSPVNVELTVVG